MISLNIKIIFFESFTWDHDNLRGLPLSVFHPSQLHMQLRTNSIIYKGFASFMHNML